MGFPPTSTESPIGGTDAPTFLDNTFAPTTTETVVFPPTSTESPIGGTDSPAFLDIPPTQYPTERPPTPYPTEAPPTPHPTESPPTSNTTGLELSGEEEDKPKATVSPTVMFTESPTKAPEMCQTLGAPCQKWSDCCSYRCQWRTKVCIQVED